MFAIVRASANSPLKNGLPIKDCLQPVVPILGKHSDRKFPFSTHTKIRTAHMKNVLAEGNITLRHMCAVLGAISTWLV